VNKGSEVKLEGKAHEEPYHWGSTMANLHFGHMSNDAAFNQKTNEVKSNLQTTITSSLSKSDEELTRKQIRSFIFSFG
jgi:hypothetical protein